MIFLVPRDAQNAKGFAPALVTSRVGIMIVRIVTARKASRNVVTVHVGMLQNEHSLTGRGESLFALAEKHITPMFTSWQIMMICGLQTAVVHICGLA